MRGGQRWNVPGLANCPFPLRPSAAGNAGEPAARAMSRLQHSQLSARSFRAFRRHHRPGRITAHFSHSERLCRQPQLATCRRSGDDDHPGWHSSFSGPVMGFDDFHHPQRSIELHDRTLVVILRGVADCLHPVVPRRCLRNLVAVTRVEGLDLDGRTSAPAADRSGFPLPQRAIASSRRPVRFSVWGI